MYCPSFGQHRRADILNNVLHVAIARCLSFPRAQRASRFSTYDIPRTERAPTLQEEQSANPKTNLTSRVPSRHHCSSSLAPKHPSQRPENLARHRYLRIASVLGQFSISCSLILLLLPLFCLRIKNKKGRIKKNILSTKWNTHSSIHTSKRRFVSCTSKDECLSRS